MSMRISDEAGPVTTSLAIGDPGVMPCSLELVLDSQGMAESMVGPLTWMLGWDEQGVPENALRAFDPGELADERWLGPRKCEVPHADGRRRAVWVSCEARPRGGWVATLTDAGPVPSR